MQTDEIMELVLEAMRETNLGRGEDEQLEISPEAPVFSSESTLDSLGLVGLLIDIEDALADAGADVTINSEHAMSKARSPFRDVPALVAFIEERMADST